MMNLLIAVLFTTTSPAGGDAVSVLETAFAERRDADVLALSEQALRANSASVDVLGKIYFWRGASLNRLRRFSEALTTLDVAVQLGNRSAEVYLERALARSGAGKEQDAEQDYREARRLLQEEPDKLDFLERRWTQRDKKGQPFEAVVRPIMGYDTNIIGVDRDTPLADEVDRESFYYGALLTARFKILEEDARLVLLEYRNEGKVFANESDLSYTDNLLTLTARIPLQDTLDFQFQAMYGETFLSDDGHFRTFRGAGPSFLTRWSPAVESRIWGDWSNFDYYGDGPSEQDRDGTLQRIGLEVRIDLGQGWSIKPFLIYAQNDADGSDFDNREWQPGFSLVSPAMGGVITGLTVSYAMAEYDNPNSLSGFAEERSDRRLQVTLTVVLSSLEKHLGVAPSVSVRFEDADSNIGAYDYTRWRPQVEMAFLALSF